MAWDFSTEAQFAEELEWQRAFLREAARERFAWLLEALTAND